VGNGSGRDFGPKAAAELSSAADSGDGLSYPAPMPKRTDHGWWPYLVPLFSFLLTLEVVKAFPESWGLTALLLKIAIPLGTFLYFLVGGRYPELRSYPGGLGAGVLDVGIGVAGAALWMAPYLWIESLRPEEGGFDPNQLGAGLAPLVLGLRVVGFGLVTPFVEELFVRSWLVRYVEVFDRNRDFRNIPIARYSWRGLLAVAIYFPISHVPWEAPVAIAWAVGTQLWFYHRGALMPLVVVHATTNLSIFLFVVASGGVFIDPSGAAVDLWFFL
jgi:CAAX prenyl protease-like protein